jgi:hypothetical protein
VSQLLELGLHGVGDHEDAPSSEAHPALELLLLLLLVLVKSLSRD